MSSGYFTPTVKVIKKKEKVCSKQGLVREIAKNMNYLCQRHGEKCTHYRKCPYGWVCEEIHKTHVSVGKPKGIQVVPVLSAMVVEALLRLSSDAGLGELYKDFMKVCTNPLVKTFKYRGLKIAARVSSVTPEEAWTNRVRDYLDTLI